MMVPTASPKAAGKQQPHQEVGSQLAPATSITSKAAVLPPISSDSRKIGANHDVRPEEQSRNDRAHQEYSSEVSQAPSERNQDERSAQNTADIGQALREALPTMAALPPSKKRHHCHSGTSTTSSHSASEAIIRSFNKNVEKKSKQVTNFPLARLGLPPPPKLANMLQQTSSSSLAWTKSPSTHQVAAPSSASASSASSTVSSYENVLSISEESFCKCVTRSYFNDDDDDDESNKNKRLRTTSTTTTHEVVVHRDETKRVIEAAMALSSIGQDFGKPAFLGAAPKQALLAPPALCPSLGL